MIKGEIRKEIKKEEKVEGKPYIENKSGIKPLRFRELLIYIWFGILIGANVGLGYILYKSRVEYFNTAIDFGKTLEVGFLIVKMIILIAVLILDLKTGNTVSKIYKKHSGKEEKIKDIEGEEGYKRIGFVRKMWFYWRTSEARKYIDKYNQVIKKLERRVGRLKGNETKELKNMKEELIKGILIWTDDFAITEIVLNKSGEKIITNKKVDKEFLDSLYIDELYEIYAINCIESSSKFVDGIEPEEILEKV